MKNYIFNLGVVASLVAGGMSVASAAPATGKMGVSGKLLESTCAVSVTPSSISIPNLTVSAINNGPSVDPILSVAGPKFTFVGCTDNGKKVFMNLQNGSPTSTVSGNIGYFTYDNGKSSNDSPIYFQYYPNNQPNTVALDLKGNGQQAVNNDSAPMIRIYKTAGKTANGYSGDYHTVVTMNYTYR
ncbi:TPA: hypothetical protein O5C63_004819 [Salmonella enterica subsp. enterica serovar Mokola]|nr:hypothetical protein [Salmonella enterica subsp. enterica serovar Corvallis]HDA4096912.1 hypothetical protein [Salmonella enterica subsp. enterica serovar Mokola]HDA4107010.1 hypothetical protein [Salmonella enterica subsp. enterica serovar Mokola]HDA4157165.1 hypothetical protein [Salmonella enterica subsp. enterica serovar Mokola]HDA4179644.1 hypothetical protein [Salmonella enterica subsp. enterica serovar Mokola]